MDVSWSDSLVFRSCNRELTPAGGCDKYVPISTGEQCPRVRAAAVSSLPPTLSAKSIKPRGCFSLDQQTVLIPLFASKFVRAGHDVIRVLGPREKQPVCSMPHFWLLPGEILINFLLYLSVARWCRECACYLYHPGRRNPSAEIKGPRALSEASVFPFSRLAWDF